MATQTYEDEQSDIERRALLDELQNKNKPEFGYTPPTAGLDLSEYGSTSGPIKKGAGGAVSGAMTGASLGSVVPGIGTALGAGAGAIVGGIGGLFSGRHNDTKDAREEFAHSLGQRDTTALWNYLGENAPDAANELRDRALNRIGKHDAGANEQWMRDVQSALDYARTNRSTPAATTPATTAAADPATTAPSVDTSAYDTDGYATPAYTAQRYGAAPSGWDQTKWADPNHQTPKYVVGRILSEAGDLKNEANRASAIANIQKAYPGAQFNGKDKISIDGGKSWVDIFGGAGAGIYSPAWMPDDAGGAAPQASSIPGGPSSFSTISSLVPTDTDFYNRLQQQLVQILGGPQAIDREALLHLLGS